MTLNLKSEFSSVFALIPYPSEPNNNIYTHGYIKTIEGTFFGLICAGLASFGFLALSRFFYLEGFHIGVLQAAILGPLLGLIAPIGDLSESLLKRDANKKDSNSLPGFGGALDLIDSLLFNAPALYLYLHFISV